MAKRIETIANHQMLVWARTTLGLDIRAAAKKLKKNTTGVYTWAKTHKRLFVATDVPIQTEVVKIMTQFPGLVDPRRSRSGADPMVIALAMTRSFTVVTGEPPSNKATKPKIPDVCIHHGVPYRNVLGMFRDLGLKFK